MSKLNKLGTAQAAVPSPITSKVMIKNHKKGDKSKSARQCRSRSEDTPIFNESHASSAACRRACDEENSPTMPYFGRLGGWEQEGQLA